MIPVLRVPSCFFLTFALVLSVVGCTSNAARTSRTHVDGARTGVAGAQSGITKADAQNEEAAGHLRESRAALERAGRANDGAKATADELLRQMRDALAPSLNPSPGQTRTPQP